jgi:Bacterial Ig-like domain
MTHFLIRISIIINFLTLIGCANIVAPIGGKKDITPPKIVKARSTPNLQTHFKKQNIDLVFDEWLKLDDVYNQVVVSPPLNERPEVTLDGKTVHVKFAKEEVLRENATYTINFGTAVKDFTEGNPASDLRFVFSTGAILDSLSFRARVVDAEKEEPLDNLLVMLYDNTADSVVRKIKPFYFARTDKSGIAKIENIKAGNFKCFVLKDNDLNYIFNQDGETIGFPDSLITLPQLDTAALKIRAFDPVAKFRLKNKETNNHGFVKLNFTGDVHKAKIRWQDGISKVIPEYGKDTMRLWYDHASDAAWYVYAQTDTNKTDTIRVKPSVNRADFLKKNKLIATSIKQKGGNEPIYPTPVHPLKAHSIRFNHPIWNIDTSNISITDTFSKKMPFRCERDSLQPTVLYLKPKNAWVEGMKYQIQLLPKAITDLFDLKNDTLRQAIIIQNRKELGDIQLKIKGLDKQKSYLIQLLTGGQLVEAQFFADKVVSFEKRIEALNPDIYTIKIVEDLNKNRVWDTGDYDKKAQPERIFWKKLEQLRSNWELEADILYEIK